MLHGHGGNLHLYDGISRYLSKKYEVFTYDQRGYGLSAKTLNPKYSTELWADDLYQFIKLMDLDHVILGGHSMSGRICATFVKKHPEYVEKLITFNTTWFGTNPIASESLERNATKIEKNGMDRVIQTSRSFTSIPDSRPRVRVWVKKMILKNDPFSFANGSRAVAFDFKSDSKEDILKSIKCPTMIVIGDRDSAPLEGAQMMLKKIKKSRLAVVPFSGHYSILEKPRIIHCILKDFLDNE